MNEARSKARSASQSSPEGRRNLGHLLTGVESVLELVGAVLAILLPILLPDRVVPLQLTPVLAGSSALALVAFLLAGAYRSELSNHRQRLAVLASASALIVIAANVAFVETIPAGTEGEVETVLVGFSYTDQGQEDIQAAGLSGESRGAIVSSMGRDRIPLLYGYSYQLVRIVLAGALCGLVFFSILGLVSFQSVVATGGGAGHLGKSGVRANDQ